EDNALVANTRSNLNPAELKVGMKREELVAMAGKPSLRVVQPGRDYSELLSFDLRSGGTVDVIVKDGKVAEIKSTPPE
ncbi:MAG TPA: hypothetical protein VFL57_18190, partial [Bryobacteraceae bacterium]|nr:hypothetical protein [Bryobacteraceae bacterium]